MTSAGRQALSKPLAFTAAAAGCLVLAVVALDVERIRAGQASLRVQQRAELLEGAQSDSKTSDWEGILAWSVKKAAKSRLQAKAFRSSLATKGSSHHIRALPGSVMTKSSQLWVAPDVSKFNLTLPRCKYSTHIGRLDGVGLYVVVLDVAQLGCYVNASSELMGLFPPPFCCAVNGTPRTPGLIRFPRGPPLTLGETLCKTRRTCCIAPSSSPSSITVKIAFYNSPGTVCWQRTRTDPTRYCNSRRGSGQQQARRSFSKCRGRHRLHSDLVVDLAATCRSSATDKVLNAPLLLYIKALLSPPSLTMQFSSGDNERR
jgi:hypothetical protein